MSVHVVGHSWVVAATQTSGRCVDDVLLDHSRYGHSHRTLGFAGTGCLLRCAGFLSATAGHVSEVRLLGIGGPVPTDGNKP